MAAPSASTATPGEVWWVHITDTLGHEQDQDRPAVVLVNHTQSKLIMAVPFTTNLDAGRFSHTHRVSPSGSNGLTAPSIAQVYQARAMTYSRFRTKMGVLGTADFNAIRILVKDYFKDYLK